MLSLDSKRSGNYSNRSAMIDCDFHGGRLCGRTYQHEMARFRNSKIQIVSRSFSRQLSSIIRNAGFGLLIGQDCLSRQLIYSLPGLIYELAIGKFLDQVEV